MAVANALRPEPCFLRCAGNGRKKQKNGRRRQAVPQIAAYYLNRRMAEAKRPSRDITASPAA
jgi:hypothetical protein